MHRIQYIYICTHLPVGTWVGVLVGWLVGVSVGSVVGAIVVSVVDDTVSVVPWWVSSNVSQTLFMCKRHTILHYT